MGFFNLVAVIGQIDPPAACRKVRGPTQDAAGDGSTVPGYIASLLVRALCEPFVEARVVINLSRLLQLHGVDHDFQADATHVFIRAFF